MLSAPSRLMNPNWHGHRNGEIPSSPQSRSFTHDTQGDWQSSWRMQRPSAGSQRGQYYRLSSHPLRCLSTEDRHRKVALLTHTFRLQPRVPPPHPAASRNLIAWTSWAFLHVLLIWHHGNQKCGHTFLFSSSCASLSGNVFGAGGNPIAGTSGTASAHLVEAWQWIQEPGAAAPHTLPWALESQDLGESTAFSQEAPGLGNVCI